MNRRTIYERLEAMPVGQGYSPHELKEYYRLRIGGVAWPARGHKGCALVLGISRLRDKGVSQVYLLDEFYNEDIRAIVDSMGSFTQKYKPGQWIGDSDHMAASKIRNEWNNRNVTDTNDDLWLYVARTPILDMSQPYQYMIPQIKALWSKAQRRLWLKQGRAAVWMNQINPAEVSEYKLGDIPPVEALAYAVTGVQTAIDNEDNGQRMDARQGIARPYSAMC